MQGNLRKEKTSQGLQFQKGVSKATPFVKKMALVEDLQISAVYLKEVYVSGVNPNDHSWPIKVSGVFTKIISLLLHISKMAVTC